MSEQWFMIINAKCVYCGQTDSLALLHFLDRNDGDRITSRCRNQVLCNERQREHDDS